VSRKPGSTAPCSVEIFGTNSTLPLEDIPESDWISIGLVTSADKVGQFSSPYRRGRLLYTGQGVFSLVATDVSATGSSSSGGGGSSTDRQLVEPLGKLGVAHQLNVSSGGGTVVLSPTCTRYTVIARGGDIRFAASESVPDASTAALLMASVERDYACDAGTSISAIKASHETSTTVFMEIIEIN
jgi:hypothetical protein